MQFKTLTIAAALAAGTQAFVIAGLGVNGNGLNIDVNSLLAKLKGGQLDPTSLLSGFLSTSRTTSTGTVDPATVLNQFGSLSSILGGTDLSAGKTGVLGILKSGNVLGNLTDAKGLIGTLISNIGKLPIDANGLVLPSDQKGLCTVVNTVLQVEASLLKTLTDKTTGVLTQIPLLGLVSSAAIEVQLLLQTLILQVLSLTPLCNVQSTESLNGLSGVFQNLLMTLTNVGSLLGPGLTSTVTTLLQVLAGKPLVIPTTPLSGTLPGTGTTPTGNS